MALVGWEPFDRAERALHRLWTTDPTPHDTDAAHARKELWKELQHAVEALAVLARDNPRPTEARARAEEQLRKAEATILQLLVEVGNARLALDVLEGGG